MSNITAIQAGSEKAFTEVYLEYHAKLFQYFLKKTRSDDMACELVQLAFIKLWNTKHTLKDDVALDAQLFTIARTSLIDYIRKLALEKQSTLRYLTHHTTTNTEPADTTFETQDYFEKLTVSLPPIRKKVFTLSRLQGLSYKEIAQLLAISVNTVEDHMSKALRQLKAISSLFW